MYFVCLFVFSQLTAEGQKLEEYQTYIDYELSQNDPARVQCLFERAVLDNCLLPDIWIQYTKYLVKIFLFFSSTVVIKSNRLLAWMR
jgi:hypothetical protein